MYKIVNCENNSISLLIDRKMAEIEIDNAEIKKELVRTAINRIVNVKRLRTLTDGLFSGNIYLKGKHLSHYLGG
ncbi:MAG: hypothetical protein Q7J16_02935 [Candidatus Cloacimonadales bacterium]|nr:hypothetical protein [Candidatus Cloacimonadales bacterium]